MCLVWRKRGDLLLLQFCRELTERFSWQPAGRLWDILYQLAYIGDLPLPNRSSDKRQGSSDGLPNFDTSPYASPPTTEGSQIVDDGPHRTTNATQRRSVSQEYHTPSTSDSQEPIDLLDLGDSLHHITIGELGSLTTQPRGPPTMPSQPMYHGTHGITTMPTGGVPMNSNAVGVPLCSIDRLLYGAMMVNIGYANTIASGMGPQAFGGFLGDGTTLGQGRPGPEPQTQWQSNNPLVSHGGGGGSGMVPNADGLTMWTNAPRGFE